MSGLAPRARAGRAKDSSPSDERTPTAEERAAMALLLTLNVALVVALGIAGWTLAKYWSALQLEPWQKVAFEVGIGAALVTFTVRGIRLLRRLMRRSG